MAPEAPISSVWPSGGWLMTYSAAIRPPAPTLFSTTTVWPSDGLQFLRNDAGDQVVAAAGGKSDDQADVLGGISVGLRLARLRGHQRERRGGQHKPEPYGIAQPASCDPPNSSFDFVAATILRPRASGHHAFGQSAELSRKIGVAPFPPR